MLIGEGGTAALLWFLHNLQEDAMRAMQNGRGQRSAHTTVAMVLLLAACGPGNVAPDDDAVGDDDAFTDDDVSGDDDAATGGTGTVAVTLHSLAIEPENTTVTAEIVLDGALTGTMAPATFEVPAGNHEITILREGFVSPTEQITVAANAQTDVECVFGRNLSGGWRRITPEDEMIDEEADVVMRLGSSPRTDEALDCPSKIWAMPFQPIGAICLRENERIQLAFPIAPSFLEGHIINDGQVIEYTINDPDANLDPGPWRFERIAQ